VKKQLLIKNYKNAGNKRIAKMHRN